MADTGFQTPGTVSSVGVELYGWDNATPTRLANSDNSYTSATGGLGNSQQLRCTNFGFSVPTGATIDGIEIVIERNGTNNTVERVKDADVSLRPSLAENKANTGLAWPTTDTEATYGGATDTWSDTFTPADINDSGFGCHLQVNIANIFVSETASVDIIKMKVYYTEAVGGSGESDKGVGGGFGVFGSTGPKSVFIT